MFKLYKYKISYHKSIHKYAILRDVLICAYLSLMQNLELIFINNFTIKHIEEGDSYEYLGFDDLI